MAKVKLSKNSVFERQEKKYLLSPAQYEGLQEHLNSIMEVDEYGLHTICTIYYDTDDYAIIRHSLDKPTYKEKLRLRSYGVPASDSTVFLELKKKMNGVTYKRRIPLLLSQVDQFLFGGVIPEHPSQISKEISWFVAHYNPSPKVLLSYDRIALFGKEDPEFRITIDANLRWRSDNLQLTAGDYGSQMLPHGYVLMEIKTLDALPFDLTRWLSALEIYPTSYSKYGTVYKDYLQYREGVKHVG